tara:strand:+ start:266 stop:751 length:486 start_codon:yes stop_codon:yes gene_type:complete
MASQLAPTPELVVERQVVQQSITGRVTQSMRYWLLALADRLNRTPEVVQTVSLTGQTASVSATTISVLSLAQGVYRLSAAARVTTAASTSSALTLTFGWTQAVACTASSAAVTGNTTATTGSFMRVVRVDAATAITYATTYASSGGTAMVYRLDVAVEQVI